MKGPLMSMNPANLRRRAGKRIAASACLALVIFPAYGCGAHVGRLKFVPQTLTPADTTGGHHPEQAVPPTANAPLPALFLPDTLIGFQPGTGGSSLRVLGKLGGGQQGHRL